MWLCTQFGPPDRVKNFTGSFLHSNSVLGKRIHNQNKEIKFIPNAQPEALRKKVKMKFETSAGEQWSDGTITSYDGLYKRKIWSTISLQWSNS